MDLKLNTRNKRMLAAEKTNGPYVWLRQASKSHHQASFVNKILRNLAWEFIYAKVTTLLFQNEAWCLCSSDESVHKGYLTRENKIDQFRTVSWCDFKGLTCDSGRTSLSPPHSRSQKETLLARWGLCMIQFIYLSFGHACLLFFSVKHFFLVWTLLLCDPWKLCTGQWATRPCVSDIKHISLLLSSSNLYILGLI